MKKTNQKLSKKALAQELRQYLKQDYVQNIAHDLILFKEKIRNSPKLGRMYAQDIVDSYACILILQSEINDNIINYEAKEFLENQIRIIKSQCETVIVRELRHVLGSCNWHPLARSGTIMGIDCRYFFELDLLLSLLLEINNDNYSMARINYIHDCFNEEASTMLHLNKISIEKNNGDLFLGKMSLGFMKIEILNNYYKEYRHYSTQYFNINDIIDIFKCTGEFKNLEWYSDYGGKKWGFIAKDCKRLLEANDFKNTMFYFDRMVNRLHATGGLVIDKMLIEGDPHDFLQALDKKEKATSYQDLTKILSRDFRKMLNQASRLSPMLYNFKHN